MPKALLKDDFRNLLEYQSWLNGAFKNLSPYNRSFTGRFTKKHVETAIRSDADWYGRDVTFEELDGGVTQYKNPELIQKVYDKVSHFLNTDIINRIKTRRLRFNALGLGVFSFERAAMTMYRLKEFYSPKHNRKVQESDIHFNDGNFLLKQDRSKVIQRWEEKPDGKPKIRTNTKELFAYFPEPPRDKHAVELFISCDAPGNTTANEMLYGGISAIIIAELLLKAGIRVKINVVIGSAVTVARETYVGCVVPVKQFDEVLDSNVLALLGSDPRFMRFDAFKGVIAAFDHFNMQTPAGMGAAMNAMQLKQMFEDSGYASKSLAQHRYYFGGTFSEEAALRDINLTIEDMAEKLQQK